MAAYIHFGPRIPADHRGMALCLDMDPAETLGFVMRLGHITNAARWGGFSAESLLLNTGVVLPDSDTGRSKLWLFFLVGLGGHITEHLVGVDRANFAALFGANPDLDWTSPAAIVRPFIEKRLK
jgi:hypothetical protein